LWISYFRLAFGYFADDRLFDNFVELEMLTGAEWAAFADYHPVASARLVVLIMRHEVLTHQILAPVEGVRFAPLYPYDNGFVGFV
jgi:hypothetical protein